MCVCVSVRTYFKMRDGSKHVKREVHLERRRQAKIDEDAEDDVLKARLPQALPVRTDGRLGGGRSPYGGVHKPVILRERSGTVQLIS